MIIPFNPTDYERYKGKEGFEVQSRLGQRRIVICTDKPGGFPVVAYSLCGKYLYSFTEWGTIGTHGENDLDVHIFIPDRTPRYRPWNLEEVPVGAVIKHKEAKFRCVIISCCDVTCDIYVGGWNTRLLPELLFQDWTLLNGEPCGVLEREEGK